MQQQHKAKITYPAEFLQTLDQVSYADRFKLKQLYHKAAACRGQEQAEALAALQLRCNAAREVLGRRKAALPAVSYDENLPVSARRQDIIEAIRSHQVVIIAGETGSGKTTQIPKMCLEAGFGLRGMIGHTQPRRIAARAVAQRIAAELNEPLGQSVGYKVRFTDSTAECTAIKLMTDGILLAETASDRLLLNYDCIIIDEAHERSLNIDFLLGCVKRILARRPELHLIITSATIDPERFSRHFNNAPIIEVSGRTYPVEVVYMPLYRDEAGADLDDEEGESTELSLQQGVLQAVKYLFSRGRGDILVFLPGERDIMDMAAFLRRAQLRDTEILPLYARLAAAEQNKIFAPHQGTRIVLATNVAETSLTVPGIRYVIDPGTARISRYSVRTKVQRLPVEPISQASANQRMGRCGRVMSGVCVRLYSEEDFNSRPRYTDPEILRTNLAAVILQMLALRLGDVESFPFIDPPGSRQVSDGLRLLEELGAVRQVRKGTMAEAELTAIGRQLARLPADPRLARMLLEAAKQSALNEALIIAAGLTVSDPRERPLDKKEAANQYHARFNDEKSDFISLLKLWQYVSSLQKSLSNSAFRRQLKHEYISYLRVREWFDLHRQLKAACQTLQLNFNQEEADYASLHKALLSGLLSHIGQLDIKGTEYKGARGVKFFIFPGSPLAKKPPRWICAAELTETSRLFARTAAVIDPLWLEQLGAHLIKKSYAEPHWSAKSGAVLASLTITLYGLIIVQGRQVQYGTIDPKLCRELMIREGLVAGNIHSRHAFLKHNQALLEEVEELEDKTRRRDLLVEPEALEAFYQARIPENIINQRQFDHWWQEKMKQDPEFLNFKRDDVLRRDAGDAAELYPDYWQQGRLKLRLTYVFDPTSERDGVSVHIPLTVINQIRADDFVYQIPGLRPEFFAALIRSLPKRLRRNLIPAPDFARALEQSITLFDGPLYEQAARQLTRMGGEIVTADDFDLSSIDRHLFVTFVIEDLSGKEVAYGKNFAALAQNLEGRARTALQQVVKSHKSSAAPSAVWNFGEIKKERITRQGSLSINAYPALTDKGSGVALELYDTPESQAQAMWQGQRRLIFLGIKNPLAFLEAHLPNKAKLAMYYQPLGSVKDLVSDLLLAAINELMRRHGAPVWNEADFRRLFDQVRAGVHDEVLDTAGVVEQILYSAHELKRLLKGKISFDQARSYADVDAQLNRLVCKGFVSACTREELNQIPRYLQAAVERLKKLSRDVPRDLSCMRRIEEVTDAWQGALTRYPKGMAPAGLQAVKWMIEELRVSFFAQTLGVRGPISDKRILQEIARVLKEYPPQR